MEVLTEKQLLPILQFTENLLRVMADYKHKFALDIVYDSENKLVTYKFNIDLELGQYKADVSVCYDEENGEENDWQDLKDQISHIQQIITA